MTKSYDLNKPKTEPKRKDLNKQKEKVKDEIESYEDMLRRDKLDRHKKEGVHIT